MVFEDKQGLIAQHMTARDRFNEELEIIRHQKERLKQENDELQNSNKVLEDKLKCLEHTTASEIVPLKEQFQHLQQQKGQLQIELVTYCQEVEKKMKENQTLQQKLIELAEKNNELKMSNSEKEQQMLTELETLRDRLTTLKAEHQQELCQKQLQHSKELEKEKLCNHSLKSSFDIEKVALQREVSNLKNLTNELQNNIDDKNCKNLSLRDELQNLQKVQTQLMNDYQSQIAKTQNINKESNTTILEKEKETLELTKINVQLKSEIETISETSKSEIQKMAKENAELKQKLNDINEELKLAQDAHGKSKTLSEMIPSMKALLSKKESSKAILVAQQENLEREHSIALSEKTSEIITLEQQIKTLYSENTLLKSRFDDQNSKHKSVISSRYDSLVEAENASTCPDNISKMLLARKESSNQILTVENMRIKAELDRITTKFENEVKELQRRNAAQRHTISCMEKRLADVGIDDFNECKWDSNKSIAFSEPGSKLYKSPSQVKKEEESCITLNKSPNMESRFKQRSFSTSEHTRTSLEQKVFASLKIQHQAQLDRLTKNINQLSTENKLNIDRISSLESEQVTTQAELFKANNDISTLNNMLCQTRAESEKLKAAKLAHETYIAELEKDLEKLQEKHSKLQHKLKSQSPDISISKEREIAEIKTKCRAKADEENGLLQKRLEEYFTRLKILEKQNIGLETENNCLQEKVKQDLKPLLNEIELFHGKIQKLLVEKVELQERFKCELNELKNNHELELREQTNKIHHLNCQISEAVNMNEIISKELQEARENAQKKQCEIQKSRLEYTDQISSTASKLESSEKQIKKLQNDLEQQQKQISTVVENYTQLEIEYFKLKHKIADETEQHNQASICQNANVEKLSASLNENIIQYKQLQQENSKLKSAVRMLQNEKKLDEEKLSIAQQDLQHANSVGELYKSQYETCVKSAEASNGTRSELKTKCESVNVLSASSSSDGLGAKTAELTNQLTQMQNRNAELVQKIADNENKLQEMCNENTCLKSRVDSVNQKCNEYQEHNSQLNLQVDKLYSDAKQYEIESSCLKIKSDQHNDQVNMLMTQISAKDTEIELLREKIEETKIDGSKLHTNESELTAVKLKLNYEQQKAQKAEYELRCKIRSLEEKVETLKRHLEEAFRSNQSLEKYIKRLKKSFTSVFGDASQHQSSGTLIARTSSNRFNVPDQDL
ncbi:hypothetical protein EB796_012253 [Bugula neritina]|uniref:Uncharacterized protein n=1 Tax=Bugula neritina TaxID=10212 RepID=A0A7J7JU42_BUGNE|nr:hypothetical protein EB796_012253 [Bugula neritina]